tara:strand:+ start:329 stop:643 length:315 start_codon:yes stop_codon:yes gene_type:complete
MISRNIRAYEKIIDDPISIPLIDNLAENVLDEDDQKSSEDFDYEIPEYEPTIKEAKEKVYLPKKSKNNKKISSQQNPQRGLVVLEKSMFTILNIKNLWIKVEMI